MAGGSYYLQRTRRLYSSEKGQVVHHNSARNMVFQCESNTLTSGMSRQEALDALDQGDVCLVRYEHLGAPLDPAMGADGELSNGLPEKVRQSLQNVGDAMPDVSDAEHALNEKKREQEEIDENTLTNCAFQNFYLKSKRAGKECSLQVDAPGNEKYLGSLGCAVQIIGKQDVSYSFDASCGKGKKSCPTIKIFHVDRSNASSREENIGRLVESASKNGTYKVSPARPSRTTVNLLTFLKEKMFPKISDLKVSSYCFTNSKNTCDSKVAYSGYVDVFPKYKWEGAISVGLKFNFGGYYEEGQTAWEIKPEAGFKYIFGPVNLNPPKLAYKDDRFDVCLDPSKIPLEKMFGKLGPGLSKFKTSIDSFKKEKLSGVRNIDGKEITKNPKSPVSCEIKALQLTVKGGYELVEPEDNRMVHCERSIALNFDPLVSATVKLDIIFAIVNRYFGKNIGKFIMNALEELSTEGVGGDNAKVKAGIGCILEVRGGVGGELGWKTTQKNAAGEVKELEDEKSKDWKVEGKLDISLKAKCFVEASSAGFTMRSTVEAGVVGTKKKSDEPESASNSVSGNLSAGDEKKLGKLTAEGSASLSDKKEDAKTAGEAYEPVSFTGTLAPAKDENGNPFLKKDIRFSGISIIFCWTHTVARNGDKSKDKEDENDKTESAAPNAESPQNNRRGGVVSGGVKIEKKIETNVLKVDFSHRQKWKESETVLDAQCVLLDEWKWSNVKKDGEKDENDKKKPPNEGSEEGLGTTFA